MPIEPGPLGPDEQALLDELENDPTPPLDLEATLAADPVLAEVIEASVKRFDNILTPKAIEHARRTLALMFTTVPSYARKLDRLRKAKATAEATAGTRADGPGKP
jgi:hypothetical protein